MKQIKPVYAGAALAVAAILASLASSRAEAPAGPAGIQSAAAGSPARAARASGEAPWKAVAASGKVEARRPASEDQAWARVGRGDQVRPLSLLRTRRRSRATLTRLGDIVLVDPESEIILPGERSGPGGAFRQRSGNALYEIEPTPDASVSVETPYLIAGVKGTVFSVIAGEGFSSVGVISGRVHVRARATRQEADLLAGDIAVFEAERGELEVYREAREDARQARSEISRGARESMKRTGRLLEEAGDSLLDESLGEESWAELKRLDLSLWSGDRDMRMLELDAALEEDRKILTNEEDGKLINLGLKRR